VIAALWRRLLVPIETWERHLIVARLLERPGTVLDVGGAAGLLASLLPDAHVVVANVRPPADVLFDGRNLPFPDGSFDAVASVDVLEHVPAGERSLHLAELARVARGRVVACWPLGSWEHDQLERELAAEYETRHGVRHAFLDEHLRNGLPDAAESSLLAKSLPGSVCVAYHGDYRRSARRFRELAAARSAPLRYFVRHVGEPIDLALTMQLQPVTNRVFVVADLGGESVRSDQGS
jgi:hypothetical protein